MQVEKVELRLAAERGMVVVVVVVVVAAGHRVTRSDSGR